MRKVLKRGRDKVRTTYHKRELLVDTGGDSLGVDYEPLKQTKVSNCC